MLAPLKLHYLRWVLFDIGKDTYFMYQGIFDTDFDKYTDDAVALFTQERRRTRSSRTWKASRRTGRRTCRPSSSSFASISVPASWNTGNIRTSRADEIKKALRLKRAFSEVLDQMQ